MPFEQQCCLQLAFTHIMIWTFAGQTKPTRIIRLLTEGTIEKSILAHQRKKLQGHGQGQMQAGLQLQEAELLAGNTLADLLASHP